MDETMNTANETAISQETETQQAADDIDTTDTQPEDQVADSGTAAQSTEENPALGEGNSDNLPFLEIKYNKEMKGLSREEAKNFAEIGMRYQEVREKLDRFATLKGITVDEFINGLEAAEDEAYRNSLMEKFGGDEETVNQMMELYSIKKEQTLDNVSKNRKAAEEAAEQSTNARIAEEFSKMKADFPELSEFSALPDEVKKAAYEGKTLEHAYLLYKHNEQKKIDAAIAAQKTAAEKSVGSINTGRNDSDDNGIKFLNALWSR